MALSWSRASRTSQPSPASVLGEVDRHLPRLRALAEVLEPLLAELRLTVDGVLQPFERRLEVLDARLEGFRPMLPTVLGSHCRSTSVARWRGRLASNQRYSLWRVVPASSTVIFATSATASGAGPLPRSVGRAGVECE